MSEKREFTGVFIPAKIWADDKLSPSEKMLLAEVKCLSESTGWCYANNKHFANWLHCSSQNISLYLCRLQKSGYLEIEYSNAKTHEGRKMRVNYAWYIGQKDSTPLSHAVPPLSHAVPPLSHAVPPLSHAVPPLSHAVTEIEYKYNLNDIDIDKSKNQFQNWLLSIKAENSTREAFSLSRKIPIVNFDEYFEAFALEATAKSESYHTRASLLSHFLNFSSSRHYRSTQKYSGGAPGRSAEPARRFATETEIAEPRHRMVVSADSEGIKEPKYRPI